MSNYNKRIYELLNRERSDMLDILPQPEMLFRRPAGDIPKLHGGLRPRNNPLPGYFYPEEPATLATGSNIGSMMPTDNKYAMRRYAKENDLDEMDMSGGKINWSKVGKSIKKGISTVAKYSAPIVKEVGREAMPIIKKEGIKALKNYLLPAAEFTAENPEVLMAAAGRKIKPRKRMSKAIREMSSDEESDAESDGSIHVDINSHKNGGKRVNARAEIVKRVMREKGLKMIEASKYVKAHGLY